MPRCKGAGEFCFGTAPHGIGEEPNSWDRLLRLKYDGGRNKVGFAGYLIEKV